MALCGKNIVTRRNTFGHKGTQRDRLTNNSNDYSNCATTEALRAVERALELARNNSLRLVHTTPHDGMRETSTNRY